LLVKAGGRIWTSFTPRQDDCVGLLLPKATKRNNMQSVAHFNALMRFLQLGPWIFKV
jgi:hypothetical protein